MAIYKNIYKKEEDEALWEIHEIRRTIRKLLKGKHPNQINAEAIKKFKEWKKAYESERVS